MLLSLPTLAPSIPTKIDFGGVGLRHLSLVLVLSRLGLISPEQYASLSEQNLTTSAVNSLIEKALQARFGDLFSYKLLTASLTMEVSSDDQNTDHYHSATMADTTIPFIADAGNPCEWVKIGPFMRELEALEPGLGRVCIQQIDAVLCWFGYPHTPSGVLDMARDWLWMGEDDEKTLLSELVEEGTNPDDLDIVRKDELLDGIPEWAYNWHCEKIEKKFTADDLPALALKHRDSPFGPFLSLIAEIANDLAAKQELLAFYEDGMVLFPPVVLCWDDKEQFDCVIDEVHDREMQSGDGAPWAWVIEMGLSHSNISEALDSICKTGQVIKALDEALFIIKEFAQ